MGNMLNTLVGVVTHADDYLWILGSELSYIRQHMARASAMNAGVPVSRPATTSITMKLPVMRRTVSRFVF